MKPITWKIAVAAAGLLAAGTPAQIKKALITDFYFGSVHAAGRPKAQELVRAIGTTLGFTVDVATTESQITLGYLRNYDLVVWNSMSQNGLQTVTSKTVWQQYLEGGGAVLALHAAGDTRTGTWTWYMEGLLDANYSGHTTAITGADVWIYPTAIHSNGQFHPILKDQNKYFTKFTLPGETASHWGNVWIDEWYAFTKNPAPTAQDLIVLLDLDEFNKRGLTTWDPAVTKTGYHPMAWARQNIGVGQGRLVFMVTGHDDQIHAFRTKGVTDLWKNAMLWASKNSTGCKNAAATNYNPWVDKDDGTCTGVTSVEPKAGGNSIRVEAGLGGFSIPLSGEYEVVLQDAKGQKLYSQRLACPCERKFGFPVPNGVYLLRLVDGGQRVVADVKVSKQ